MVEFLSKINFRSRDRSLKSEILTFHGILKISAGKFTESQNKLSADFIGEKPALMQK
jgi:hypothetical protein